MKVDVKNIKGDTIESIEISDRIFGSKFNLDLIHQAVVSQDSNARRQWAHTKDRGDVRGGGKKPWQQKGTGRARHGSIRSPLWIGGGVTFGPTNERSFAKKINKKMKKAAVFSVLSKKLADKEIIILDNVYNGTSDALKTKNFVDILNSLFNTKKMSVAVVFSEKNKSSYKFIRNLKGVMHISPKSLNAKDLLISKNIIIERDAINDISNHYKINSKI